MAEEFDTQRQPLPQEHPSPQPEEAAESGEEPEEENVARLLRRLTACPCFPHEIGLFLGYPLEDVRGFMENCGRNYRLCGCWKVYGDPEAALRCFARYRKCARLYLQRYTEGHSLSRLTVAG